MTATWDCEAYGPEARDAGALCFLVATNDGMARCNTHWQPLPADPASSPRDTSGARANRETWQR